MDNVSNFQFAVKHCVSEIPANLCVVIILTINEGKDNEVPEEIIDTNFFDLILFHIIEIVWSIYSLSFEVTGKICRVHPTALWTNVLIFALRDATLS